MQANARPREGTLEWRRAVVLEPELAEQVVNRTGSQRTRVAERQVAHRAHDLLELARRARYFGFMEGVVRSRRQFVHEKHIVVEHEHLDGENSLQPERRRD